MVCHSLGGAVGGADRAQYPAFPLGISEVVVGLWPLCIFFFLIAPTAHACSYFQQLLLFSFSLAPGDVRPRASTPVKGPRSQPISLGPALTELSSQRGRWNSQQTVTCRGRGEAGGADAHAAVTAQRNCLSLSGGQGRLPGGGHIQRETSVMHNYTSKSERKDGEQDFRQRE